MTSALLLFVVVFVLNLVPAFAPPTWMVLSYVGFSNPSLNLFYVGVIAALAATLGRVLLAKMSRDIFRNKLLDQRSRENVTAIKDRLENRKKTTVGLVLFYALTPLPSNLLFMAYGLTGMRLLPIAIPFFCARIVGYSFWGSLGSTAAKKLSFESLDAAPYLGAYFILSQFVLLGLVYAFTKVDWKKFFEEKKLHWMAKLNHRNRQ